MDLSQSIGACPVCRSSKYHKSDDGFLICEFGHQSQRFWEEHEDNETYFGVTRRLQSQRSRLSQVLNESPDKNEILRTGDVEKFVMLELQQILLNAQVKDLKKLMALPQDFEKTLKMIWLTYVSNLDLAYDEEGVHEVLPRSRSNSQVSLQLESEKEPDLEDISSAEEVDSDNRRIKIKPNCGRIQMSMTIPILGLAFVYHQIPLYLSDILKLIIDCKISYFNISRLVPKELDRHLNSIQRSYLRNLLIPDSEVLTKHLVQCCRMMMAKFPMAPPKFNIKLVIWRIGELLYLPYLFREDLIALAEKFELEDRLAIEHERFSSSPLISAFALTIFFLRLHYGLLDCVKDTAENIFTTSGFPTQHQLVQIMKFRLKIYEGLHSLSNSHTAEDLEFYKNNIISSRLDLDDESGGNFDYLKRALGIDAILKKLSSNAEGKDSPSWLKSDPNKEFSIEDFWAKNYPSSNLYPDPEWPEAHRLLLRLGSRFCCCRQAQIQHALISMYETKSALYHIRSFFK